MKSSNIIEALKNDSFWQVAFVSASALSLAYLSELIANLQPCILCIYQRLPYFLLLFISLLGIWKKSFRNNLSFLIILCFIVEVGLAFYHVGVEHYIFAEDYSCKDNHQIANLLSSVNLASSCSEAAFRFMNFSMAEWNLIFSSAALSYFIYREKNNVLRRFK